MSSQRGSVDPGVLWRSQPEERMELDIEQLVNRRTRELSSATRAEIWWSVGAALFLIAAAWRVTPTRNGALYALLTLVVAWVLLTLYRFRDRLRPAGLPKAGAAAVKCIDYYRGELARRRDHLRSEWLWHGPLFLACAMLAVAVGRKMFPGPDRLRAVLPFVALLAGWAVWGFMRRRRQAAGLQMEIERLERERSSGGQGRE